MKPIYVTTPIYYVNDIPHLGHAYTTIAGDILARYGRMTGRDVKFLTGTDEHGEKVQIAAEKAGKTPQQFTDDISLRFRDAWTKLDISIDDFIRTTEERHKREVLDIVSKTMANGDIYLGQYEGWYCVPEETFWQENQILTPGKCPTCGRDLKKISEENYFFKLSKYKDALLKHIETHPDFIMPESKKNEVLGFLREDLRDISVSRTSFSWGIPFPKNEKTSNPHVIYVWYDALINYISALDPKKHPENFEKFWGTKADPRAIHIVGKDILKFHTVYWPSFLMSVGLPLPKRIYAHGWWTSEGQKMSKSIGNTVEPIQMTEKYGHDAFRLYLFREFPFGQDGDFSMKNFKERVNNDLANNLGNLVSRSLTLIDKNLEGKIEAPPEGIDTDFDAVKELVDKSVEMFGRTNSAGDTMFERFEYNVLLAEFFSVLTQLNKYINTKTPWYLAKDPTKKEELEACLYRVTETLRIMSLLLWPFIPHVCEKILARMAQTGPQALIDRKLNWTELVKWGNTSSGKIEVGTPLFPRIQ